MKTLKDQLAQSVEGYSSLSSYVPQITNYSYIQTNLEAGKGVADSIQELSGMIILDVSLQVTPQQALDEKNAAINLLKL